MSSYSYKTMKGEHLLDSHDIFYLATGLPTASTFLLQLNKKGEFCIVLCLIMSTAYPKARRARRATVTAKFECGRLKNRVWVYSEGVPWVMPAVSPDRIPERKAGQATLEFPLKTEQVSERRTEMAFVQSWNQTGLTFSLIQEPNWEGGVVGRRRMATAFSLFLMQRGTLGNDK